MCALHLCLFEVIICPAAADSYSPPRFDRTHSTVFHRWVQRDSGCFHPSLKGLEEAVMPDFQISQRILMLQQFMNGSGQFAGRQ